MQEEVVLEVSDLVTRYGSVEALHGVSIEARRGQIAAIVGANGAGKTTLLASIMKWVRPAAGSVVYEGQDITSLPTESIVARGLTMVPEGRRIIKKLTVKENLHLAVGSRGGRGDLAADEAWITQLFPILAERAGQQAGLLSGGEAQQLAIARALMGSPQTLLLDEPSLGLAPRMVERVFDLIPRLRERGITVVVVEQNAFKALSVADYVYVMQTGRIHASGTPESILEQEDLLASYLGSGARVH